MQVCSEVPVIEPLLKRVNGVRIHRGRYVIAVRLHVLTLDRLLARPLGVSLVLDVPGKEQR